MKSFNKKILFSIHFLLIVLSPSFILSVDGFRNIFLNYSNLEKLTNFDRCNQIDSNYVYNISTFGQIDCIELKCNKNNQIKYDNQCLNCPTSDCSCPPGTILKQNINKLECLPYLNNNKSIIIKTLPCSISHWIASNGTCICPQTIDFVEENNLCFRSKETINDETRTLYSMINLEKDAKFLSNLIFNTVRPAIWGCFNSYHSNYTACNYLLNICTVKLISMFASHPMKNDYTNLCSFLTRINSSFIYEYPQYHLESHVPVKFKSLEELEIISLSYSLNGTYLGIATIFLESFYHCWNSKLYHQRLLFGQSLEKKCSWNVQELLRTSRDNKFYEFYFKIDHSTLIPIPIKIIHYENKQNHLLLKRYFFADSSIGIEDDTLKLWFLLFAKKTILEIEFDSSTGQILVPRLLVDYRILEYQKFNRKSIKTYFEVDFRSRESSNEQLGLRLTLFISLFLSILWSIFKTWIWRQQTGNIYLYNCLSTFTVFIVKICQACTNLSLTIILFYLSNQLFVFKYQNSIHSLLPSRTAENEILIYLFIIFLFKTIQICAKIYEITSIDIFFIDWEKPRKKPIKGNHHFMNGNGTNSTSNGENHHHHHNNHNHKNSDDSFHNKRYKRASTQFENISSVLEHLHTPVTIWRSYFVANEWYELSKKRRINLFAHICSVVMFLEGSLLCKQMVKSMPSTIEQPELENLQEISTSITGRIVFASLVYVLFAFIQYFYQHFLRETCGASKLNEFMDLCTVSNISVFCLLQPRFGYYLHGLSPNGRSEVNMMEMYELLELEESDLCSKRGLMPNTEQQTFEIYLPYDIYNQLSILRRPVDACQPTFIERCFSCTESTGDHLRSLSKEKLFQVYLSINRFLTAFIDHAYDKVDYRVLDKNRWETSFGFEVNSNFAKFYNDNGSSMENILFFGLEVTFITFEMLSFLIVDFIVGGNFMLAGIGSAALSLLIKHFYVRATRQNLVQKTLVDDRFLI